MSSNKSELFSQFIYLQYLSQKLTSFSADANCDDSNSSKVKSATIDQPANSPESSSETDNNDIALECDSVSNFSTSIAPEPLLVPCKVCASNISSTSSHICIICNAVVHPFCGDGMDDEGKLP